VSIFLFIVLPHCKPKVCYFLVLEYEAKDNEQNQKNTRIIKFHIPIFNFHEIDSRVITACGKDNSFRTGLK